MIAYLLVCVGSLRSLATAPHRAARPPPQGRRDDGGTMIVTDMVRKTAPDRSRS